MLAKIQGLFRLTRNCELRYLPNGTAVAKLGLACSEKYGDKETQLFIDATIWGKQSETFNQYAGQRGTQVFIVGKLQTEQWEQDGQKRSKISMIIESFDFVSNKQHDSSHNDYNANNSQNQAPQQQQQSYQQPQQQRQMPSSDSVPVIDIDDSEIPFAPIGLQYPMSLFVM